MLGVLAADIFIAQGERERSSQTWNRTGVEWKSKQQAGGAPFPSRPGELGTGGWGTADLYPREESWQVSQTSGGMCHPACWVKGSAQMGLAVFIMSKVLPEVFLVTLLLTSGPWSVFRRQSAELWMQSEGSSVGVRRFVQMGIFRASRPSSWVLDAQFSKSYSYLKQGGAVPGCAVWSCEIK
jgi:hypothetical protein